MTILYIPRLIESAEQAEALPVGTVTLPPARHRGNAVATVKGRDELWRETGSEQPFTDVEMVDEIALVPIEAEEERSVVTHPAGIIDTESHPYAYANFDSDGNVWFGGDGAPVRDVTDEYQKWAAQNVRTRYVTPWEEA